MGEPHPGSGNRADPMLLRLRRPRGCLPRSEQILRSIQLLKERFCCYSAFPCVCGVARAPQHPPPIPDQGLDVPRDVRVTDGRLLSPAFNHISVIPASKPLTTQPKWLLLGSFITFIVSLNTGLFGCVVVAGRFTVGFIPVASCPSSALEQEQARCDLFLFSWPVALLSGVGENAFFL